MFFKAHQSTPEKLSHTRANITREIQAAMHLIMTHSVDRMEIEPLLKAIAQTVHDFNADVEQKQQQHPELNKPLETLKLATPDLPIKPNDSHHVVNAAMAKDYLLTLLDQQDRHHQQSLITLLIHTLTGRQSTPPGDGEQTVRQHRK